PARSLAAAAAAASTVPTSLAHAFPPCSRTDRILIGKLIAILPGDALIAMHGTCSLIAVHGSRRLIAIHGSCWLIAVHTDTRRLIAVYAGTLPPAGTVNLNAAT